MKHYACDIEATTPNTPGPHKPADAKNMTTEAYLIGAMNIDDLDEFHCFYNMDDFMHWVLAQDNCNFDWFNSTNYDGHFMIYWLEQHGYRQSQAQVIEDSDETPGVWRGGAGSFTVFKLDVDGITGAYNFIDVYPLIGGSIRMHGDALGYGKGETPLVPHGSKLTDLQKENGEYWTMAEGEAYLRRDCEILARAMHAYKAAECLENGINTQSSLAFRAMLKEMDPREQLERQEQFTVKNYLKYNGSALPATRRAGAGQGSSRQSVNENLSSHDNKDAAALINKVIRGAYKGGFNWVNPRHADTWVSDGVVLDINSMYPSIYMGLLENPGYDNRLPGQVVRTAKTLDGLDNELFIIQYEHLTARVHDDAAPIIKPRTDDEDTKMLVLETGMKANAVYGDIDYPVTLTSVEQRYLENHYEITRAEIKRIYVFNEAKALSTKMRKHGERWMKMKETSTGVDRAYAKLMLNSVYGKLGEIERGYPVHKYQVNSEGALTRNQIGTETGGRRDSEIPAAAFITAIGRVYLGESINKIGLDRFLYCDTDSMHLLGSDVDGLDIDSNRVGAWKIEAEFTEAKFIKCKTYGEMIDGEWHTTTAGLAATIPKDIFKVGAKVTGLRGYPCKGGTILIEQVLTVGTPASNQVASRARIRQMIQDYELSEAEARQRRLKR